MGCGMKKTLRRRRVKGLLGGVATWAVLMAKCRDINSIKAILRAAKIAVETEVILLS